MSTFDKYRNLIQKEFPEFPISSLKKIGEGDNSKAFLVNENYIFRFPKRRSVKQQIQREICVLPKIKNFVNLPVPEFELISPQLNFVGYQKINGDILSNTIFFSLSKTKQEIIQKQLGNFLTQIHSFPLDNFKECRLETMDLKEEYSENFEDVKKLIYPETSKRKQKIITQLFNQYLGTDSNFEYLPTLIHNDFSKDHILFDTVNQHPPERFIRAGITGIIDFGDIAFGDPDYDFMYLLDEFGEKFLKGILKYYVRNNRPVSIEKIIFFTLGSKIQILLACKSENDGPGLEEAFKDLNHWFRKYNSKK